LSQELRRLKKPIQLVVNKTDGLDPNIAISEFFQLGLGEPVPIAASHGRGIVQLIENALTDVENVSEQEEGLDAQKPDRDSIQLAIIGRPNVGKSTLVNRILGEDRVVVFDGAGTTRDSIYIPFERQDQKYTIIDTAGVRRRARISETVEKFSVVKALQAIEASDVVILVIDATEGITDQDLGLLGFVIDAGKALVVAVNKWDGLTAHHKEEVKRNLVYRLQFAEFAKIHYISALHGTGVGKLFSSVQTAYQAAIKELPTSLLTSVLEEAVKNHTPPMVNGRRIKLRYAHTGGHKPPIIVIHGNQTEHVPISYKRYLINTFREALKLEGTPIRIDFKTGTNPFAGKRNLLTARQLHKRKRLKKHTQKKD
jgi:GTP-binding protein